jgi:hypothetical protein
VHAVATQVVHYRDLLLGYLEVGSSNTQRGVETTVVLSVLAPSGAPRRFLHP